MAQSESATFLVMSLCHCEESRRRRDDEAISKTRLLRHFVPRNQTVSQCHSEPLPKARAKNLSMFSYESEILHFVQNDKIGVATQSE